MIFDYSLAGIVSAGLLIYLTGEREGGQDNAPCRPDRSTHRYRMRWPATVR